MRTRLEERSELATGEAFTLIGRALRYVAPFKREMAVKIVLMVASLLPLLVLPWPIKILIDHVIRGIPLDDASARFPFFMRPFLDTMAGASPSELLLGTLLVQVMLLALIGAFGTTEQERDSTSAYLAAGWDSATQTENEANAGFSLAGGLLGLLDFRWTLRLTQRINHHYRTRLFERIQSLPMAAFDDERPYFASIATAAVDIGAIWIRLQERAAGLNRVFFLMDLPAEQDRADARPLPRIRARVRAENVSFRYDEESPALDDVSFEARIGEITALAGPAGAGKTTLAYLVPRLVRPNRGRITIDDVDLAGVTGASLRSQIGFVFQETVLFDATVEENIRLGKPDASEAEVRRAAQIAGADEFIRALPKGYATPLGRAGGKLSVGQKQRLAIARALVRDPPILILDEPTSALDPDTERRLVAALRRASRQRIVIVIAHRLSTIREADQILFLDAGRIVERGSHAELMARPGGAYRRFVELQTRGAA